MKKRRLRSLWVAEEKKRIDIFMKSENERRQETKKESARSYSSDSSVKSRKDRKSKLNVKMPSRESSCSTTSYERRKKNRQIKVEDLEDALAKACNATDQLQAQVEELLDEVDTLKDQIQRLEGDKKSLENENDTLRRIAATTRRRQRQKDDSDDEKGSKRRRDDTKDRLKMVEDALSCKPKPKSRSPSRSRSPVRRARKKSPSPRQRSPSPQEFHPSAVMVVNRLTEIYNQEIPNNIQADAKNKLVDSKMKQFLDLIGSGVEVLDVASGKQVLKNLVDFKTRYGCVFRESGSSLKVTCSKRFVFENSKRPEMGLCLDLEKHESLVTPRPGTRLDGSLGCLPPRTQHLVVLYLIERGRITMMWIAPDKTKVGEDKMASEDILERAEWMGAFKKVVEKVLPNSQRHFQNYHFIEQVG